MDGPTTIILVLVAVPIFGLGAALIVAPVRVMSALHEWYLVAPRVRRGQHVTVTVLRAAGLALMVFAVELELNALHLAGAFV